MAQEPEQPNNLGVSSRFSSNAENYGVATTFESNKYNVDNLQYPSDLFQEENNPYGGNYAIFYINVNEDSKLLKDRSSDRKAVETVQDITPRERGFAVGTETTKEQSLGGSVASGAVTGAGASAVGLSGKKAILGGGFVGAAANATVGTMTSTFSRKQKRMKTCIALHIPPEMNIKYGVQWAEEDTAVTAALFNGADKSANAIGKYLSALNPFSDTTLNEANKSSSDALNLIKSSAVNLALSAGPAGDYVGALTGMAGNPKKEQLFKGVDFRTFMFTYQFFPRDVEEARRIREIIKTFKLHMHPEFKDPYNMIYLYPSEFDIYYYQNGKENMNLHRHTSCVLTDMNINYTPQGVFSAFDDGMPSQITVMLTFRELSLLTKDHIEDGY